MKRLIFALLFAVLVSPMAKAQLPVEDLSVVSGTSEHRFKVEIANEPDEISTGLMNRTDLAETAGMLFDFGPPREANMWMKNTLIPLDMLFVDDRGTIIAIAHNTVPGSLRRINPGLPVKGVVELKGGMAKKLGIEPGHTVKHKIFGTLNG